MAQRSHMTVPQLTPWPPWCSPNRPGACLRAPAMALPAASLLCPGTSNSLRCLSQCLHKAFSSLQHSHSPHQVSSFSTIVSPPETYLLWQTGRATAKTCRAAAGRSTPGPSSSVTRECPAWGHTPSGQPHQVTHLKAASSSLMPQPVRQSMLTPGFSGRLVEALSNLHRSSTSSSAQSCFHPLLFTVLIPSQHLVSQPPNQRLLQENPTLKHLPASRHLSIILLRAESLFQCVLKA